MRPIRAWRPLSLLMLMGLLPGIGCSRAHYFHEADREVDRIIAEKSYDPRWAIEDFSIAMDPRSRYFDPHNQISPPMPPDDPDAHHFMHCMDCKKGAPCWHRDGDRVELQNPSWREQLGTYVNLSDDGRIILNLDTALQLARIHSTDYQEQLEGLYLSALDVSTERFQFDVIFNAGNDTTFVHNGRLRGGGAETNTLTTNSSFTANKRLATAGQLLVGFANRFVWQFAGPDTNATMSLINFSLVQPLLRAAGRDIALETLTRVERGMLANLRNFERFRQGFYGDVVYGQGGGGGVQRLGGFQGGTGLTGFTGQGAGGFGGVGQGFFGGGGGGGGGGGAAAAGAGGLAGGGAGSVGGFIGLLQSLQELRNQQDTLDLQLQSAPLMEALLAAGRIDLPQLEEFRQTIETNRAGLLNTQNNFQDSLDQYKIGTLGLPPDIDFVLDDGMIRQFQFIDRPAIEAQNELARLQTDLGNIEPGEETREVLEPLVQRAQFLLDAIEAYLGTVPDEFPRLREAVAIRKQRMTAEEAADIDLQIQETILDNWESDVVQGYLPIPQELDRIVGMLDTAEPLDTYAALVNWRRLVYTILNRATLVQARLRVEAVTFELIPIDARVALEIARCNRLDWANARASLVDEWRLVTFNADRLQSNLDVFLNGDIGTRGSNPVEFRGPTGTLQAGVQFDAPLTRLEERNSFRQSLIQYQQRRRGMIQLEDQIHFSLRSLIRQLDQYDDQLEISRRAALIAIRRVDQTLEDLNRPPEALAEGQAVQIDQTAVQEFSRAITDLGTAQNALMSVWLVFHASRMGLMQQLGLMQVDENGVWIDRPVEFATLEELEQMQLDMEELPPALPLEWLQFLPEEIPTGEDPLLIEWDADDQPADDVSVPAEPPLFIPSPLARD